MTNTMLEDIKVALAIADGEQRMRRVKAIVLPIAIMTPVLVLLIIWSV